jgi:hypothetical protein
MENPYQSPPPTPDFSDRASLPMQPGARERGLVGHVRIVGILMIVQGVLSLLMGLMLVAMAIFMGVMFSVDPPPGPPNGPPPETMAIIMGCTYGVMGLCGLVPGIMHIYSGLRVYQFKSRPFALITLFSGLASTLTCYCSLTAIGLVIYGLIVMFDRSVQEAFALVEKGYSPDQVDLMFNPYANQQFPVQPPKPQS